MHWLCGVADSILPADPCDIETEECSLFGTGVHEMLMFQYTALSLDHTVCNVRKHD